MRLRTVLGTAVLMIAVSCSARGALAQESEASHPADIRGGSCASLGEVVAPLNALAIPAGDPQGQAGANPVSQSITEVPLPLTDILAASHAIAAFASPEEVGTPIACGEIGGALGEDGSLAIGLQAMNGAKMSGVSYFTPSEGGESTIVTVLLVDERGARERGDEVADGADDGVDGGDPVSDGSNAADGVGNVAVPPAPDEVRGGDGTDASDPSDAPDGQPASSLHPGDDGTVDRPGQDRNSDGGRPDGETGHRGGDDPAGRGGKSGNDGGARAGEDGRTS